MHTSETEDEIAAQAEAIVNYLESNNWTWDQVLNEMCDIDSSN